MQTHIWCKQVSVCVCVCVFEWGGGVVGMGKGEMGDLYIVYIGSLKGHILKFLRALLVVILKKNIH